MTPLELIQSKRAHVARLANQRGAAGEQASIEDMEHWVARPSGAALKILLEELRALGSPR
jgi:hypothetical protein